MRPNPWFAFNRFIGGHMMVVAPLCVLVGVLFPRQFEWMSPAVEWLFAFMTFQSAMGATARQMLDVVRRPKLLVAALVVELVAMPLIAFFIGGLLLPGQHDILLGIVLEYCVPMGVNGLMWTEIFTGNKSLSLGVVIISTVLAPFTMPLTMQLLMGTSVHVDVWGMMVDLLEMVAIPAVLGIACNDLSHGKANAKVAPWIAPLAKIFLILVLIVNSTHISDAMHHLNPTLVMVAAMMAVFGASGYVLGYVVARLLHAGVGDSLTCGITTGARNISSGAVIAQMYFPDAAMFPVMMGTLFQHVIAAAYGTIIRRMEARHAGTPARPRGEQ
ncbi:MAG: bile acid:sodium symporter family protein [Coriobacteriia bacterium]|nr:bile acid:sodium symporter family protein [Coriobacteriia bacterium]MBS5477529.1 bile acid:sodium symporter family protein [Coriobacteriia bacterium]